MDIESKKPIFFVCNDPERALGLENVLDNYHIICTDNSTFLETARESGINIFSLSDIEKKANPVFRNSNRLLQNKKVQQYIKENTPKGEKANIIVFKVSLQIEKTCQKLGYNLLNTTSALNKKFELKISQYNNLKSLNTFFPKTIISTLNNTNYSSLKNKLGDKSVIQYNRGHTGNSTVFVNNEKDYNKEKSKYRNRLARIAQYIQGDIYTLNACITRFGIAYGGLSYQITGIEGLTSRQGGTIGNDWSFPKKVTPKSRKQIQDLLSRLEKELVLAGYKGLFGIDIIITPKEKVFLIEINARQPASTPMHTKLMLNEEFIPLQAFHFAEFLFNQDSEYIKFLNKYFNKGLNVSNIKRYIEEQNKLAMIPIQAAQIFFRNIGRKKQEIEKNITQGVYVYNQKKFIRTGQGYSIQDIIPGEHLILSTNIEQIVSPDHEVARLQTLQEAINTKGEFKKEIQDIVDNINKKIVLKK
jgi:glutathione synthase/RimK-type ligase-like ATP-grasp enzyme